MKKQVTIFILLILFFISCKSEEQRLYDELIRDSNNLVIKLSSQPYSSLSREERWEILDERSRIINKANQIRENAKIDDRPTIEQQKELLANFEKMEAITE
ncbi:hypothetical protein PQG44_05640 [Aquirufa sp. LEPPI-3A]|uniref:hypothetical protein n=1 Tax=Aquirufa regiilacus TaxID=3024868 RepID=UPI0028DD83E9|nr:hypothetical protein [Aquirufa sp. LEPPI-3A]MDT8887147.1 hypothetical protein [Aquirufa sp. LEPPI-3A]